MRDVVIIGAARTPIGAFSGGLSSVSGPKLGATAIAAAVERAGIQPEQVNEVIMGCVLTAGVGQAPARQAAILAQAVNQMVNLKYGREDELESDLLGFQFMTEAGYNPEGIVELMEILNSVRGGEGGQPEFLSTHPNPANRIEKLVTEIEREYPNGIPAQLQTGRERFARIVNSRL